jgi:hypothetical protein
MGTFVEGGRRRESLEGEDSDPVMEGGLANKLKEVIVFLFFKL